LSHDKDRGYGASTAGDDDAKAVAAAERTSDVLGRPRPGPCSASERATAARYRHSASSSSESASRLPWRRLEKDWACASARHMPDALREIAPLERRMSYRRTRQAQCRSRRQHMQECRTIVDLASAVRPKMRGIRHWANVQGRRGAKACVHRLEGVSPSAASATAEFETREVS